MTRKSFETRLAALESAKGVRSGEAKIPPALLECLDAIAAHAGQGPKESKAEAVGRALGMDCGAMRDLLKRDAFQFWVRVLNMAATLKEAGQLELAR
jgi:hypothetical protein